MRAIRAAIASDGLSRRLRAALSGSRGGARGPCGIMPPLRRWHSGRTSQTYLSRQHEFIDSAALRPGRRRLQRRQPVRPLLIMVVFVGDVLLPADPPQQKKAKDQQAMISQAVGGDEVVTTGGILGRIIEVGDTFVTLEIADGVRVKVQKSQVT